MGEKFLGEIHQILHGMYLTDAIANDVFEIQKVLRSSGYKSEIFAKMDYDRLECKNRVYDYEK